MEYIKETNIYDVIKDYEGRLANLKNSLHNLLYCYRREKWYSREEKQFEIKTESLIEKEQLILADIKRIEDILTNLLNKI